MGGALRVMQLVSEAAPESYIPRYMIGVALLGAERVEEGSAAIREVFRLEPNHDFAKALLEEVANRP